MSKIYSSKYYYFAFNVKVGNSIKKVTLNGGTYYNGKQVNGRVVVRDENVAKAIEESVYFKKGQVFLIDLYGNKIEPVAVESKQAKVEKAEEPVVSEDESGVKKYDCKTTQAASRILNSEYGIPFNQVNTKEKVLAKAKELNIEFSNIQ